LPQIREPTGEGRQSEIEEKFDPTKNKAPSHVEAVPAGEDEQKNSEKQTKTHSPRTKRRAQRNSFLLRYAHFRTQRNPKSSNGWRWDFLHNFVNVCKSMEQVKGIEPS
jgi:hypothetical protein